MSDYEQERDGVVTFTGHGVYTYAQDADEYSLHWFDCLGTPPEVFRGRLDGDVFRLGHGGPGMHARMTSDFSVDGQMNARMEMSAEGADWRVLFEATYRRR